MAEQLDLEGLRTLKAEHPDYTVVAYINTTSELKTECDVCVTSSSAVEICSQSGKRQDPVYSGSEPGTLCSGTASGKNLCFL